MSPEQAEGRKVDARTDIFSFGAVLYEMVTGRRAFAGDSNLSVLAKILNEDPAPPSTVTASVSSDVERAILRCLRKDPARRYQTMADLKVALDDLAADSTAGQPAQTPAVRRSRPSPWAWPALIAVVAGGYFGWQALRTPAPAAVPLHAVPLTALPGIVRSPSFSPDGNHVAFTWTGPKQDNTDVYVQQIGAGAPLRLTQDAANDYSPAWSPDGRAIAFLRQQRDSQPSRTAADPASRRNRTQADRDRTARVSPFGDAGLVSGLPLRRGHRCHRLPDGTKPDALFVVSIESGEKRQLTTPQPPVLADTDPRVSPDGRWLVFRRDIAPFSGQLQVVQLDGSLTAIGEPRSLTPILLTAYSPEWISNSEIIFSAKGSLRRMNIAEGSTPERLPFVGEDGLMPAVSRPQPGRPSRLAYVRSFADTEHLADRNDCAGCAGIRRRLSSRFRPPGAKASPTCPLTVKRSRSCLIVRVNGRSGWPTRQEPTRFSSHRSARIPAFRAGLPTARRLSSIPMRKNTHTELSMWSPLTAAGLAESLPIGPRTFFPASRATASGSTSARRVPERRPSGRFPSSGGDAVQVSPTARAPCARVDRRRRIFTTSRARRQTRRARCGGCRSRRASPSSS